MKTTNLSFLNKVCTWLGSALKGIMLALVCFHLSIISTPLAYAQSPTAMTGDPEAPKTIEEQRAACTAADKYWDSELNSCMTKQVAIDTANQAKECAESEDPQACYMQEAESETGVLEGDKYNSNNIEMVAQMVAGAYALFSAAAMIGVGDAVSGKTEGDLDKGGGEGSCTSKYIFWGTSAAWIAGDMFLKHRAKKNFEKLAKEYSAEAGNEEQKSGDDGSYQAQVRAFHYLKSEQEQVKQQATYRRNLQIAVIGGFAASLGFAIYEQTPSGWPGACKRLSSDERDTIAEMDATETDVQSEIPDIASDAQATQAQLRPDSFAKQAIRMGTSAQIAIGAGLMLAINGYLIFHANKEKNRAQENIEAIDEALKTFAQYVSGFCPDGRDDLNNERCYCYTDTGEPNENRGNSVICQNLFKADNINYSSRTAELKPLSDGPRQGCLTVTGQFDVDCKCRQMINNVTKQNACAKTPNSTAISGGLGAQLGAGNAMSTLGSIPQGANKALANLNAGSLNKNAARSKKLVDSMIKQSRANGIKIPATSDFNKMADQMVKRLGKSKNLGTPGNPIGGRLGNLANSTRPAALKGSLALAEKKAAFKKPTLNLSAATGSVGSKSKGNGFKFNWNDQAAREGNKVQTFMDKNYKYKGSDIVKRDDVSLWNVISKRYQTSGLRRLFGEEDD